MNYNKVVLIGRLGKDADLRFTQNGERGVLNFTMATSKRYRGRDGNWAEETQWHTIVYWISRNFEAIHERLKKGALVLVEGEIAYRTWEDKNNVSHNVTEIRALKVMSLEKSSAEVGTERERTYTAGNTTKYSQREASSAPAYEPIEDMGTEDDMPF